MKYLEIIDVLWPEWHARASCHPDNGHDPALWFPETSGGRSKGDIDARELATREARRICGTCPVIRECRDYANQNIEPHGVWGGVDRERNQKRKQADDDAA